MEQFTALRPARDALVCGLASEARACNPSARSLLSGLHAMAWEVSSCRLAWVPCKNYGSSSMRDWPLLINGRSGLSSPPSRLRSCVWMKPASMRLLQVFEAFAQLKHAGPSLLCRQAGGPLRSACESCGCGSNGARRCKRTAAWICWTFCRDWRKELCCSSSWAIAAVCFFETLTQRKLWWVSR